MRSDDEVACEESSVEMNVWNGSSSFSESETLGIRDTNDELVATSLTP